MRTIIFLALISFGLSVNAQLKVSTDGSIHTGYTGYSNFWMGTYNYQGTDNGQWGMEIWNGNLNFWKPWPSPNPGNYKLFIRGDNGYVGIGRYPSYKLDVDGDIATYGTIRISSDARLKSNIQSLSNCMFKINQLKGKSYTKGHPKAPIDLSNIKDTIKYLTMLAESKRVDNTDNSTQLGLLAQDVKQVFPELVKADSAGYYTVDYIGLIPVIIEALKEQQSNISKKDSTINALNNQFAILQKLVVSQEQDIIMLKNQIADIKKNCCNSKTKSANANEAENSTKSEQTILYQNIPNPFNQTTEIKYFLTENIRVAVLYIYNMQGIQIKSIPILNRGNGSESINGSELRPGMYLYTLVADGNVVDTKRMILTQ
jgi:Chaperone of endosialidase